MSSQIGRHSGQITRAPGTKRRRITAKRAVYSFLLCLALVASTFLTGKAQDPFQFYNEDVIANLRDAGVVRFGHVNFVNDLPGIVNIGIYNPRSPRILAGSWYVYPGRGMILSTGNT
ncbi:MAG: hypothetical protein ACREAM_18785, partial [Blastocatellia bacterium]